MVRLDSSGRARSLLVAVVVGHVLLISAQVGTRAGPSLLRTAIVGGVTSLQEGSWIVVGGLRSIFDAYASLRGVRADNARLEQENLDLRAQLQEARANAAGAESMRALLELRPHLPWRTSGATVIAGSTSPDFNAVTIDKGQAEGIRTDMPVVGWAGVVGRVVNPAGHTSTVQFIVDRSAAAAGRTERKGSEGIALGNGDGTLRFEYLSATADVQRDDLVLTSGVDGIYPAGLTLGRVEDLERTGTAYKRVTIRPAVDFSRLETVLVIVAPLPGSVPVPSGASPGARAIR
jgi:rod shape-determining protein MreC